MHFQKDALGKTVIDKSVQRSMQAVAEQTRREVSKTDNSSKDKLGIGPFVLGLFMFCILCNCLLYVYQQSMNILASHHAAETVPANPATSNPLAIDYASVVRAIPSSWHRIAANEDVDYLRIALRTASLEAIPRASGKPAPQRWNNPGTGHNGTVTAITAPAPPGCHLFQITRQAASGTLSDQVHFCADGSIRSIKN